MTRCSTEDRFRTRYRVDPETGCWLWVRGLRPNGYATFMENYKPWYAHRWSYTHFVGPIPEGLEVDHLCRVRHCVNPAHLEAVTRLENIMRSNGVSAINARKTHCPQGHPYAGVNLRMDGGSRKCAACRRARDRAYLARKREERTHDLEGRTTRSV